MKVICLILALMLGLSLLGDDIATLKSRWIELNRLNNEVDDYQTTIWMKKQNPDGSFQGINYNSTETGLWDNRRHWRALQSLAMSYRYGNDNNKNSPAIRDAVIRGIEFWNKYQFTNRNWWYQSIGIPLISCEVILTMGDALPPKLLHDFRPVLDRSKPGMTGQNLVHLAMVHFMKGLIYNDEIMVRAGRDMSVAEISFAALNHEGLQVDFSFHQHYQQLQFGNYGLAYLYSCAWWAGLLQKTRYTLSDNELNIIVDYFTEGMQWVLYNNLMDFSACGRQIAGKSQQLKFESARKAMLLLMGYPNPKSELIVRNFFADTSVLSGNRFFWRSDFMVHRRKNWYCSIKMCSARVVGSESNNQENMLGRNSASGVILMLHSGKEYLEIMPLWNWRRLPGLTAIQDDSNLRPTDLTRFIANPSPLVGGISDGNCGAAMLNFDDGKLQARKSYLCFEDYVVMLGNGICSELTFPVNTTIDSCWGPDRIEIGIKNMEKSYTINDGKHCYEQVEWVTYNQKKLRFLSPVKVNIDLEHRNNNWKEIQPSFKAENVSGKVLTIYLDHGKTPRNASYAYIMGRDCKAGKDFLPLKGDHEKIHAGYDQSSETSFALFYAPGCIDLPGVGRLQAFQPSLVMSRGRTFRIADPLQTNTSMKFCIDGKNFSIDVPQGPWAGNSASGSWDVLLNKK